MRLALAATLLTLAVSPVSARPVTIGAGFGSFQTEKDSQANVGGSGTLGVFGRVGLTRRLGVQVEAQRLNQNNNVSVRRLGALGVLELGRGQSRLVPLVLAGIGLDSSASDYVQQEGQYAELGLGLEYRLEGGLVIGADFRMGERSQTQQGSAEVFTDGGMPYYDSVSPLFTDGSYRSIRVGAGMRF